MKEYYITEDEIKKELVKCKKNNGNTVKIPLYSNFIDIDGKLVGVVERHIETAEHLLPSSDDEEERIVH